MAFSADEVRANRDYFAHKLHAEKQRNDVLNAVEGKQPFDFILLDTRGREAFVGGHIPGARCVSLAELEQSLPDLPKDKEIVTYCWSHD
jgi:rhodanese-related sulfurtransferase